MKIATYEGVIENGKVRLIENIRLPEKRKVYIIIPDLEEQPIAHIGSPRLLHPEQMDDFKKEVLEETNDASL